MAMTEKQGGSDVRANTTVATPLNGGGPGAEYELTGHKWFCSAPMCDAFLVLAQTDGGLSCFLVPRWTPDGERNRFHIQRLKDKLGNRSNASSEVEFDGAWARLVGEEGRGVPTIIEMVNHTRLDCVIGATAGYARRRRPGDPPRRPPLGLRRRADRPAADAERARRPLRRVRGGDVAAMRLARAYDEVDRRRRGRNRVPPRSPTPSSSTGSASARPPTRSSRLECLGGNGYVEESGMPRLFRESPLNSIWEGSGNVQCLDVLRAMVKNPGSVEAFFAEVLEGAGAEPRLDAYVSSLRDEIPGDIETIQTPRPPHSRAHGPRPPGLPPGPLRRSRPSPTPSAPPA